MHPDTQNLIPPMKTPGNREDVVELFRQVLQQLPDLRISVERWAPTENAVMVGMASKRDRCRSTA